MHRGFVRGPPEGHGRPEARRRPPRHADAEAPICGVRARVLVACSRMTTPTISVVRGRRVHLRRLEGGDREAFIAAVLRSTRLHDRWVSPVRDAAGYDGYLARTGAEFVPCGLFTNDANALAGVFNLSQIFMGSFCSAYLGYFAFEPYARRGLMREGLDLLLRVAFEQLSLHRIEANVQPDNRASIALVQRCGFEREGYSPGYLFIAGAWRDHERWAIRREIWRPEHAAPGGRR